MMLRTETTKQFAHRANIARYQRILSTYLTAEERRFVERRVAEEQAAIQHLAGSVTRVSETAPAA